VSDERDPAQPAASDDPRTYDYSQPERACDVVMKGGITSGMVYPLAICEMARVYRLTSIGGTSVGAVAAAGAAAAEFGRQSGGFARLAELPGWLGSDANLRSLFQPQPVTRPLFAVLMSWLSGSTRGRLPRVIGAALASFAPAAALGALPGLVLGLLLWLDPGGGPLKLAGFAAAALLALLGTAIGLAVALFVDGGRRIVANRFGLVSGMPSSPEAPPAMTPWLSGVIEDLAGNGRGGPLTFGDLGRQGIDLVMMTTDLTHRRAQRLPLSDRSYFFDPDEWRSLFPGEVVDWLVAHPPPLDESDPEGTQRVRAAMHPRLPLPDAVDLPVIVAARMSLSFPLLISAVPLWAFDRTLKRNNLALQDQPPSGAVPLPERCWFSDGGISSNFPVHFFDAAIPTRPTFAIDLDGFHPDFPKAADEAQNVYLPDSNFSGLLENWHRFPSGPPNARHLVAFSEGIVRTMQNRVDSTLARQPGYRDRIVHVHTDRGEGGMNLTMPPSVLDALTKRGQAAGRLLVARFAQTPGTVRGMSWDNHRWVRYRASMAALAELLRSFAGAWRAEPTPGERTYEQLASRTTDTGPNAYRFASASQRDLHFRIHGALVDAGADLAGSSETLEAGSPRPRARARIVPPD